MFQHSIFLYFLIKLLRIFNKSGQNISVSVQFSRIFFDASRHFFIILQIFETNLLNRISDLFCKFVFCNNCFCNFYLICNFLICLAALHFCLAYCFSALRSEKSAFSFDNLDCMRCMKLA